MRYFRIILAAAALLLPLCAGAQADKTEVRAGNRKFKKGDWKASELDYRKAVLKDSTSVAGQYDLASALYRQEDWQGAAKALDAVKEQAAAGPDAVKWHYNRGDAALQQKDYAAAVTAFREALLLDPADLDAKENYIYAKKMLENQQSGGGGQDNNENDNQDQNQDQQDQNQDQQDQDQDQQDQDRQDQDNPQDNQDRQEQKISPQQAQQMLQAIQAKEKETQDKVKKEKAAVLKSRQKEKNW